MALVVENKVRTWLSSRVSSDRLNHSLGVLETVTELCAHYGTDPAPLRLAALLHDAVRELPPERMLSMARELGIRVRPADEQAPVLLHGRLAAAWAERELGISDPAVVSAIVYHTAGHPQMSFSDKLFFLADHIEPGRGHSHVRKLREMVYLNVDKAMLYAIEINERFLISIGAVIDPDTHEIKRLLRDSERPANR